MIPQHVVTTARRVRAELISRTTTDRDLAGECGLASMKLADALGDVDAFRIGFFLRWETFWGKRGRYPYPHAWCRVGRAIVDVTATQFGRFPAVYVIDWSATDRYVECASGAQAIDEVTTEWALDRLPEYRKLTRRLREMDADVRAAIG